MSQTPQLGRQGLANSTEQARARWVADGYRYQVYQYEERAMLRAGTDLRHPTPEEREELMGFSKGHSDVGLPPNERESLVGNSFHSGVLARLLQNLPLHLA